VVSAAITRGPWLPLAGASSRRRARHTSRAPHVWRGPWRPAARPGVPGALWWPLAGGGGGVSSCQLLCRWGPGGALGGRGRVGVRSPRPRLQAGTPAGVVAGGARPERGEAPRYVTPGGSYSPVQVPLCRRSCAGAIQPMRGHVMPMGGGRMRGQPVPARGDRDCRHSRHRVKCKASKCVRHTHAHDDPKRQSACADPSGASKCMRRSTRGVSVWLGVDRGRGEGEMSVTEGVSPSGEVLCCGMAQAL